MTTADSTDNDARTGPQALPLAPTAIGRLYRGQTSIDFHGRRRIGAWISLVLLVLGLGSLVVRGLDLGIDFEGGVSWDVPGSEFTIADAERVLSDNGLDPAGARIQQRASDSGEFIKVQVGVQDAAVLAQIQSAFAAEAGVGVDDVSVNAVSASWGREITDKAIRALLIFTAAVAVFISIRYEWRMAIAAIAAMVHDVVIAVGIYSLLGFVVTPATVVAFLTILGYSLYDTIVIFDRIRENETRFEGRKPPYADVVNTTLNQVLMRTVNTSLSSMVPVLSILVIGAGLLGASTLAEFAIALTVGMLVGAYSSLFVAAPLLGVLKQTDDRWRSDDSMRARGPALRELVTGGAPPGRRTRQAAAKAYIDEHTDDDDATTGATSRSDSRSASRSSAGGRVPPRPSAPPRPRKKKKR
ncbi:MAG: protein translocase subunit SecF [Nocardiopsis sp. BM-2018]|nr:MAG: protein translocase subunit SecF [Nocardiopsis sp. BM-2018]